jgi:hypothetical protein
MLKNAARSRTCSRSDASTTLARPAAYQFCLAAGHHPDQDASGDGLERTIEAARPLARALRGPRYSSGAVYLNGARQSAERASNHDVPGLVDGQPPLARGRQPIRALSRR